ncbi:MAG: hypothetical protein MUC85_02050 [Anaerolineales bacterium]|nr:hypothetical protein [Anaerolineales bacterium]
MLKQLILGVLITTITIAAGFSVYNTQAARQVQAQAAEPAPTLPAYTSVESDFQAADEAAVPAVMADQSQP